jgi:O-antigen ligase/polysaccharide polymerase Wzy-like membrane protein
MGKAVSAKAEGVAPQWSHTGLVVIALVAAMAIINAMRIGIGIVAVGALIAAALPIVNLSAAIYLMVFLAPWQLYLGNWPGSTYTFRFEDLLILFTGIGVAVRWSRRLDEPASWWSWPFWLFIAMAVTVGLSERDLYGVGKFLVDWMPCAAFAWIIIRAGSRISLSKLLGSFVLTYSLQAIVGMVEGLSDTQNVLRLLEQPIATLFFDADNLNVKLTRGDFNFLYMDRITPFGTFLGATDFAVALAVAATIAWGLTIRKNQSYSVWYGTAAALLSTVSLFALKRSGWVALAVGFVGIGLSLLRRRQKMSGVTFILWLCLASALVTSFTYATSDILVSRATDQIGWEFGRQATWPVYLTLVSARPIQGYGPTYPQGTLQTGMRTDVDYAFGPENTYLHLALTAGLPAMLGMVAIGLMLVRGVATDSLFSWIIPAFMAFAAGSFFVITLGDVRTAAPALFLVAISRLTTAGRLRGQPLYHKRARVARPGADPPWAGPRAPARPEPSARSATAAR